MLTQPISDAPAALAALQLDLDLAPSAFRRAVRRGKVPPEPTPRARRAILAQTERGIVSLSPGVPEWPSTLAELRDSPVLLHRCGAPLPSPDQALAVVGSRTEDPYARRITRALVSRWVASVPGGAVVTGGGLGVDAAAMQAALDLGAHLVVVLPTPVDRPRPRQLAGLFERAAEEGTLLSEAHSGCRVHRAMFRDRNRVVAALARATVVVRARDRSGSLNTLGIAASLGRPVIAPVGPIDDPCSEGLHHAIEAGLATPLWRLADLPALVGADAARASVESVAPADPDEQALLRALGAGRDTPEALAQECSLTLPDVLRIILRLELRGRVRRGPGMRYTASP